MKPHEVTFYVYAEDEAQVKDLQRTLNDFVRDKYNKGVLVTASKMKDALLRFGNNFVVTTFLKR